MISAPPRSCAPSLSASADKDHALLVNFHHMICDGSSLAVFYGELAALYEAYLRGQEPLLPAPSVRYADYALWQQRALHEGRLAPQLAYWRRQLSGRLAPMDLPMDGERSAIQTDRGGRVSRRLSGALSDELKRLARSEQATLFMILLAALKLLLARLSGENDIVVGSTVAGRDRSELDGLVGFFINALALRSDLSGNPRFVELLRRVREVCLEAYTHQDAPFELVVEELGPERDPRRHPVFPVLFNMADDRRPRAALVRLRDHQAQPRRLRREVRSGGGRRRDRRRDRAYVDLQCRSLCRN